ncbi:MAG: hypothetical protein B7Y88_12110 [Sphingomonadales bacterium 32-64-17]|nr:MAG: hypothetical protein B7Y88_12110 [Sphingomonadales bacterium 32-64-17]
MGGPLFISPAASQSPARQPALEAAQAIQLFAEAGFPLVEGRPVNRCGRPSNPRIAFVDLNGDGAAEAHIADVDPACYGKPGAYFAILGQAQDGSWKRLIAEDGIVGFEPSRTQGWSDLSLEARDSACPGPRRFTGSDYGAPTACAAWASTAGEAVAVAIAGATEAPAPPLTGTRIEQLAQLLRNIAPAAHERSWVRAMAAFPGASWGARESHRPNWYGSDQSLSGVIRLDGVTYDIGISGTAEVVNEINIGGPGNDNLEWSEIAAAIPATGASSRNIGCHSPTGFGYVRLTFEGQSAVMHKFMNYGTAVPSTDHYNFMLIDPMDGKTEAEVAADRTYC